MSTSDATIRRPRLAELPSLQRLFSQAVRTHFAYFPDRYQRQVIKENNLWRLSVASFHPRRAIFVAVADGQVVGYAIGGLDNQRIGYIFWLFVEPSHRGANLGLKLLSRLLRHFEQQGAIGAKLGTYDHQAYYQRQGFREEYREDLQGVPITYMSLEWKRDQA